MEQLVQLLPLSLTPADILFLDYTHEPGSSIATGYVFSIRKCTDTVNVSPDRSDDMFLLTLIQSHMFDTSEIIPMSKRGTFSVSVLQSGKKNCLKAALET